MVLTKGQDTFLDDFVGEKKRHIMEISLKYPLYISFYCSFSYKKSNHIVVVNWMRKFLLLLYFSLTERTHK